MNMDYEYSMTFEVERSRNPFKRWRENRRLRRLFDDKVKRRYVLTFRVVPDDPRQSEVEEEKDE